MVILKDIHDSGTYIEYNVKNHYIDEMEGSQLFFRYIHQDKTVYELNFGWTNLTVHSFISMLKEFPLEEYDGYFSHFEKYLEVKWDYIAKEDYYNIHFTESDMLIIIKAKKNDLILFGESFEKEWIESPVIE